MTTDQLLTYATPAVLGLLAFLGKLALADRDRRFSALEGLIEKQAAFIAERIRVNDGRWQEADKRITQTEIHAGKLDTKLEGLSFSMTKLERTIEKAVDRIEEATIAFERRG